MGKVNFLIIAILDPFHNQYPVYHFKGRSTMNPVQMFV